MIVEIHGTNSHNCGAEMMAIEISRRLRARHPGVTICVPPDYGDAADRAKYDFFLVPEYQTTMQRRILSAFHRWAPRWSEKLARAVDFAAQRVMAYVRFCRSDKWVSPLSVDTIIDASGFAFSDEWGRHKAQNLYEKIVYRRRRNIPLILLPQAMGPFELSHVAPMCDALMRRADLVYARDRVSLEMVLKLTSNSVDVRRLPDFTISLKTNKCEDELVNESCGLVVPNYRMIDKGNSESAYLDFLERSVRLIEESGFEPILLLHEGKEDYRLVEILHDRSIRPRCLQNTDPLVLKGYLNRAAFVIGSRFHALVSALSQGVPAIAAGWSHKYRELYDEFGVPELIIEDLGDLTKLDKLVRRITDISHRKNIRQSLQATTGILKEQNEQMWLEVFDTIERRLSASSSCARKCSQSKIRNADSKAINVENLQFSLYKFEGASALAARFQ